MCQVSSDAAGLLTVAFSGGGLRVGWLCPSNWARCSVPTYSETRWWSKWEVNSYWQFVKETKDLAPTTLEKLKKILDDPLKLVQLKMELPL